MRARCVTHVGGLIFTVLGRDILLCFVLPSVVVHNGQANHTIPGGRIQQLGRRRFEHTEVAILRELTEEVGLEKQQLHFISGIGAPIVHKTGRNVTKLVQGFAGVAHELCLQPKFTEEIAQVLWQLPDAWSATLETMNANKRQLVLRLMREAVQLNRMYPCIKRELHRFLEQTANSQLQLAS